MEYEDLKIAVGVKLLSHQPHMINVIADRILVGYINDGFFTELSGDDREEMSSYEFLNDFDLGTDFKSFIFPISVKDLTEKKKYKTSDLGPDLLHALSAVYYEEVASNLYFRYIPQEGECINFVGDGSKEFKHFEIDFDQDYYSAVKEIQKKRLEELRMKRSNKAGDEDVKEVIPKITAENSTFNLPQKEELIDEVSADSLEEGIKSRIIAQDEACEALIDAYDRNSRYGNYEGMKSNVLIIGPSGVGKTEMSKSLAALTDKPIVIFDVTRCTSAGYVGDNVVSCLRQLIVKSNNNIQIAEEGIVVLDEIDKLASSDNGETIAKQDVQYELLKMLDGGIVEVPMGGGFGERMVPIDTSKITFIGSGAFSDLYKNKTKRSIGFNSKEPEEKVKQDITTEDLINFGLEPELLRRFSTRIVMNSLSRDDLKKILLDSKISAINMYKTSLLAENNVSLVCTDEALDAIIDFAQKHQGGASGLKGAVDHVMTKAVRSVGRLKDDEAKELIISKETVSDPSAYKIKVLTNDKL